MSFVDSLEWKAVVGLLGFAAALASHRLEQGGRRQPSLAAAAAAALCGSLVFFNFGAARPEQIDTYANPYELFHYQLGAKYFPELGYDGLYLASIAAEQETAPRFAGKKRLRDLRDNGKLVVHPGDPLLDEVKQRFTEERWRAFVADHAYYLRALTPTSLDHLRMDHGFNATPAWTFVGRLFAAPLDATPAGLLLLASLDLVLMAVAFGAVLRCFGPRPLLLCIAIFGLTYGTRFVLQGAFLRLDWLAALLLGVCALRSGRPAGAGLAFGYATASRVFPVVFFAGAACVGAAQWLRGERPRWPLPMAGGFAAALLAAFLAGGATGRGFAAWAESARNIEQHRGIWVVTRIAPDMLVVLGPETLASTFERRGVPRAEFPLTPAAQERRGERWWLRWSIALVLLAPLAASLWLATPWEGAVLGSIAFFALGGGGAYYWILLCAAPLGRGPPAVLATLAIAGPLYAIERWAYLGSDVIHMRYVFASAAVWGALLVWTLPDAWRLWRQRYSIGGRPAK